MLVNIDFKPWVLQSSLNVKPGCLIFIQKFIDEVNALGRNTSIFKYVQWDLILNDLLLQACHFCGTGIRVSVCLTIWALVIGLIKWQLADQHEKEKNSKRPCLSLEVIRFSAYNLRSFEPDVSIDSGGTCTVIHYDCVCYVRDAWIDAQDVVCLLVHDDAIVVEVSEDNAATVQMVKGMG